MVSFLEGLKRKSRYVIALQDYNPAGGGQTFILFTILFTASIIEWLFWIDKSGNYLLLQKGDLIILQQESSETYATGWCYGENERTGKKGDFPAECVYLLPTMSKPPTEILVL